MEPFSGWVSAGNMGYNAEELELIVMVRFPDILPVL